MSEDAAASIAASESPRRLSVRVAQKTDVGLVRSENQDFAILSSLEEESASDRGRLMIVADGMGGHRGGATASRMAATIIKQEYYGAEFPDPPSALRRALQIANEKIFVEAQSNPELRGMGTTCSALVVRGDEAFFAHVGDSRIYLVRADEIRQITQDHSLVASMVREGLITSQEAEVHPRRNVLQRSMGVIPEVEIDVSPSLRVQPGDIFILCSDGLHGLVRELEMKEVVKMPLEEVAGEFVKRAIDRGAPDNVTVMVARVEDTPSGGDIPGADSRPPFIIPTTAEIPLVTPAPAVATPVALAAGEAPAVPPAEEEGQTMMVSLAASELLRAAQAEASDTPAAPEISPSRDAPDAPDAKRAGKPEHGRLFWILVLLIVVSVAGAAVYIVSQSGRPAAAHTTPAPPR